ncbi:FAD-dependent oxidoreductase [Sphingomonas crocodyli]|uniref:D-amino-acid oxidase n=2 Tax=Sphingomonas crocodyli TaxID=1979270 RepID=A0A437M9V9_9SPHN|nr:FAD-dependent oxidoreductase [Sphingomonas crocodyli]
MSGAGFGRRDMLKASAALGGLAGLSACATVPAARLTVFGRRASGKPWIAPMRMNVEEIVDVKCCIRPFRPKGPCLDAVPLGDTLVIHNYGHGGSGWSLSWGSAEIAVTKALSVLPREIAVIGCGIIGLTTAVVAQRAGLKVTIYARELFNRTRSVRANGSWTPDSRIALTDPAGPGFGDVWEQMARISWKAFRSYLGLPGKPVDFSDQYNLSNEPIVRREHPADPAVADSYATKGLPQQDSEFGHYADRIKDIIPQARNLEEGENPFPTKFARTASQMHFNFGSYGHLLMQEFYEAGGHYEMRDFHSPADFKALREKVVINCTGYAARELVRDNTIIPVRGQTGWLIPQPEAHYGFRYNDVSVLSKSDGVMIMNFPPNAGELYGVNDSTEIPDRADIEDGVRKVAPLFADPMWRA